MSARLRVIDRPAPGVSWYDPEPGDMWLCPSANGSHDVPGRAPCWVIRLPGTAYVFHTNMEATEGGFWEITGDPPNVTVNPSIHVSPPTGWHGWIRNGEMTEA